MEQATGYIQKTAAGAATMSLSYIMLGFALAAALAWMELVRFAIKTYVRVPGSAGIYLFLYAVITTILAVVIYNLISRYTTVPQVPIVGIVG